jgi:ubiquinone/menaquinone biosynthesis C-methylase UbiE
MISKDLLNVLCCPVCRHELTVSNDSKFLECKSCERYHIKEGVPILMRGKSVYDDLYSQMNFSNSPFGYNQEYAVWRKSQINKQIAKYLIEGTVLDDGGGYGFLKECLDKRRNKYYNLDCSYEILRYDNSELRCIGEGEALPFKDEVFDNVVSGDVLEHVQDKLKYLEESYRVLRYGGIFIINTPREGWVSSYKGSIWFFIPYFNYVWVMIRNSLPKKETRSQINEPKGVIDIPSDENWLRNQLEKIGYEIIVQSRTDNHLFSFTGSFSRKFADIFIDPQKYGHCVFFCCRKCRQKERLLLG